jgi:hypothetical protein
VFLLYVVWKSIPGLGGWTSGSLVSLYVLLGIGVAIMVYVRATNSSEYFATRREVFTPGALPAPAAAGQLQPPGGLTGAPAPATVGDLLPSGALGASRAQTYLLGAARTTMPAGRG